MFCPTISPAKVIDGGSNITYEQNGTTYIQFGTRGPFRGAPLASIQYPAQDMICCDHPDGWGAASQKPPHFNGIDVAFMEGHGKWVQTRDENDNVVFRPRYASDPMFPPYP